MYFVRVLFLVISAAFLYSPAVLALDKYGQDIPEFLDKKVTEARKLRLSYLPQYNPKKSIKILMEVLSIKNDYYRALYNISLAYAADDNYKDAIENFQKALLIKQKEKITDATIYNSFGWVYMNAGEYDKAVSLFKAGISSKELKSDHTARALFNNLGLVYFYTQKFDLAKNYLRQAVEKYQSEAANETLDIIRQIERNAGRN